LLAALPMRADGGLRLTCIARSLAPGARAWMEVEAQSQRMTTSAGSGFTDSAPAERSGEKHVWEFQVPANGSVAPASYGFALPAGLAAPDANHFGAIYLKTRFRLDSPDVDPRAGYGEVHEVTLGVPIPPGVSQVSRCLRLREEADRLVVEMASDCSDAAFAKAARGDQRVRVQPPAP
jgi:hypothetical protein